MRDRRMRIGGAAAISHAPITPIPGAQHRSGNSQPLSNLAQRPAAARQQPHRLPFSEKVAQAAMGVAYVAAASMIPVLVVNLALWLNDMGLSSVISHLTAAAIGAVVSVILGMVGLNRFKLTPTVTFSRSNVMWPRPRSSPNDSCRARSRMRAG
jgi:hypothetical protein